MTKRAMIRKNKLEGRTLATLVYRSCIEYVVYPPANGANERSEICVVSRGGNFFN